MATAQEMKARLAKYATANKVSADAPAATTPAVPKVELRDSDRVPDADSSGESQSQPAPGVSLVVRTDVELQPSAVVVLERAADAEGETDRSLESNVPRTNLDLTNPVHSDFLQRLDDLERALIDRDPLMKTHLGAIHKTMIQYDEIANLLTVEEIHKIMAAQQQHTGMVLRQEVTKSSKSKATAKAAKIGLSDV